MMSTSNDARLLSNGTSLIDQRIIDTAVEEWRKRLPECVAAGGDFEHNV